MVEAHLHVADRHDLRKKPMSIVKIKLLQLEKSCHQTCLFEDMLNSYCAVVRRHFSLAIHAFTDVFKNNLSALKRIVITPAEFVKKKDDNETALL